MSFNQIRSNPNNINNDQLNQNLNRNTNKNPIQSSNSINTNSISKLDIDDEKVSNQLFVDALGETYISSKNSSLKMKQNLNSNSNNSNNKNGFLSYASSFFGEFRKSLSTQIQPSEFDELKSNQNNQYNKEINIDVNPNSNPTQSNLSSSQPNVNSTISSPNISIIQQSRRNSLNLEFNQRRQLRFEKLLSSDQCDLLQLRQLTWSGIPDSAKHLRGEIWRLLLSYSPTLLERRKSTLDQRRKDYKRYLKQFWNSNDDQYIIKRQSSIDSSNNNNNNQESNPNSISSSDSSSVRSESERILLHQIRCDVPRTQPDSLWFRIESVQLQIQRILYIFAIRHPAAGYVQGLNDILCPFLKIFTIEQFHLENDESILIDDFESINKCQLSNESMSICEADSYWCLSSLVALIQSNYISNQPGIQQCVYSLEELIKRIDPPLHRHLINESLPYLHFAFRWFNCLLLRELNSICQIKFFDALLSESHSNSNSITSSSINLSSSNNNSINSSPERGTNIAILLQYITASFLLQFKSSLMKLQFQELILFLQKPPTSNWTEIEMETILAQAHMYIQLYHGKH